MPSDPRKPLWLIPNLLSLDAPLVAVAWLYMFAKTWRVDYLPWAAYFSLGLVVWVIYVADRLLDASMDSGSPGKLEARHQFHLKHRRIFKRLVIVAGIVAVILVVTRLPFAIYGITFGPNGYIGYAIIGGLMVAAFFALSLFSDQGPDEIPHAKNIIAGAAFAYGTAMIAYAFTSFDFWEFIKSRQLICFGVLCVLNISAIDFWEHANRSADPEIKATDELALTLPLILLGAAALIFAAQDHEFTTRPFFYSILTGAALLYILNRIRARFQMDALRVLADVALLLPFVVFLALAQS
ncbi:hypothetical protein [Luteolibacter sp.]|uniref:hypothetical protein n=1 Tax=Luteolibacter sp. TaxID=1962973 RepID=UPI003263F817